MKDEIANRIDCRLELHRRIYVAPVQVYSISIDSIVPPCHPIRVEDGEYVEHKIIPQDASLFIIISELIDNPSHHMGPRELARMNSGRYYDSLFVLVERMGFSPAFK